MTDTMRTSDTDTAAASATVEAATDAAMRALGRRLGRLLRAGDVVILSGPLGAGKTTLTQGIGEGLDVRGPVTSPTFVISRIHPSLSGGPALVHVDAYRLGDAVEVDDLDLDTEQPHSVTIVEWGEGVAEDLSDDRLEIAIERRADDARVLRLTGSGALWADVALGAQ
jgi:tRNA threonylcarbamoyladenosine biosynthesis protein TsaE